MLDELLMAVLKGVDLPTAALCVQKHREERDSAQSVPSKETSLLSSPAPGSLVEGILSVKTEIYQRDGYAMGIHFRDYFPS